MVHRDSLADQDLERVGVSLPGPLGLAVGFFVSIVVTMTSWAFYSGFVLDRAGPLTLDRGGGQALLMILLSAMVASAVAGLMRWARAVAADRAVAPSLSANPVAPAKLHLETRRVQVIRPAVGRCVRPSWWSGDGRRVLRIEAFS